MVYFSCSGCNESLKKPQVAKHLSFCRRCHMLTCLDCQKDFTPQSYVTHNQCISELEKYSGRNYVEPANANKGQKKQLSWMDSVRAVVAEYPKQHPLDSRERRQVNSLLSSLLRFDNIPRKKAKFENFVKSAIGQFRRDQAAIDGAWAAISAPPMPQVQAVEPAAIAKKRKLEEEEEKVEEENEKENEESDESTEPKKKKKKHKKKKDEREEQSSEPNNNDKAENGVSLSEEIEKEPMKKKRRKETEDSEERTEERSELKEKKKKKRKKEKECNEEQSTEEEPTEQKKKKKQRKEKEGNREEQSTEEQPTEQKKKKRKKEKEDYKEEQSTEEQPIELNEKKMKKEEGGKTEEVMVEAEEAGDACEEAAVNGQFVLCDFVTDLLQRRGGSGISLAKLEKRAVRAYLRDFARPRREPRPERVRRKLKVVLTKHFRQIDGRVFARESD